MADQAKITSLESLETFRASLIVFLNKAHTRLDEVGDDIRRTKGWLQQDRRLFWQTEIRRRRTKLDQAEQELMTARMSSLSENHTLQMMNVRRAREAVADAEKKLENVRRWSRDFETTVSSPWKKMESLRAILDHEMPKALAYLTQVQQILEEYAEIRPASRPGGAPESAEGSSTP